MPATQPDRSAHTVGLVPVITLVLWTGCLLTGAIGLSLPYARPRPTVRPLPPVTAQKISVVLKHSLPGPSAPAHQVTARLPAPPLTPPVAVAAPSPALAFALPVPDPVSVTDAAQATPPTQATAATQNTPVQPLVFGQGEGRQPAPLYPSTAIRQGQEGTVTVRLDVDADGRVTSAEASAPSPWPLLNEAAIRTVRERWRFAPGASRSYEVAIRFTLQK